MGKVIFEYNNNEDRFDIELAHNAFKMYSALDEIYNIVRLELKHGDDELSDHINQLLERIIQESYFITDFY